METIYSRASAAIKKNGWAKNSVEEATTPKLCITTALGYTSSIRDDSRTLFFDCIEAVNYEIYGTPDDIMRLVWEWNDHPDRTEEEVHALLQRLHKNEVERTTGMDIGDPVKEVEFEPITEPAPVEEPTPVKTPEPEKVPA